MALVVPDECSGPPWTFLSDCSSDDDDSLLDSLESFLGKCRLDFGILTEDSPETLAAEEPMIRSLEGGKMESLSRSWRDIVVIWELEAATEWASMLSSAKRSS